MGPLAENKDEHFTYGDYLKWDDSERWELIDGIAYNMTPAPSRFHQQVSIELCFQLVNHLRDTTCKVYAAPFDVRLLEADEADESVTTVVQPDISVICDPSKLDDRGCKGSPDLIVEILSPATARKDRAGRRCTQGVNFLPDTSGSMSGLPVEKAKEAMLLARDGLYPQDTFNLITFSGDIEILFPVAVLGEGREFADRQTVSSSANRGTAARR